MHASKAEAIDGQALTPPPTLEKARPFMPPPVEIPSSRTERQRADTARLGGAVDGNRPDDTGEAAGPGLLVWVPPPGMLKLIMLAGLLNVFDASIASRRVQSRATAVLESQLPSLMSAKELTTKFGVWTLSWRLPATPPTPATWMRVRGTPDSVLKTTWESGSPKLGVVVAGPGNRGERVRVAVVDSKHRVEGAAGRCRPARRSRFQ